MLIGDIFWLKYEFESEDEFNNKINLIDSENWDVTASMPYFIKGDDDKWTSSFIADVIYYEGSLPCEALEDYIVEVNESNYLFHLNDWGYKNNEKE